MPCCPCHDWLGRVAFLDWSLIDVYHSISYSSPSLWTYRKSHKEMTRGKSIIFIGNISYCRRNSDKYFAIESEHGSIIPIYNCCSLWMYCVAFHLAQTCNPVFVQKMSKNDVEHRNGNDYLSFGELKLQRIWDAFHAFCLASCLSLEQLHFQPRRYRMCIGQFTASFWKQNFLKKI